MQSIFKFDAPVQIGGRLKFKDPNFETLPFATGSTFRCPVCDKMLSILTMTRVLKTFCWKIQYVHFEKGRLKVNRTKFTNERTRIVENFATTWTSKG